jgi:predicted AAA+ superfamily ATPase
MVDLQQFFLMHQEVMSALSLQRKRYLYEEVRWEAQGICIVGSRGVGKTTMMCQACKEQYDTVEKALYISADNIHVLSTGLFAIAQAYFQYGGEALFIDEVHKYPDWSLEIKNILDVYKKKKIVFSASSSLDLNKSKYDLSRRVVYYELLGLSFREYLNFTFDMEMKSYALKDILSDHVSIAEKMPDIPLLKIFTEYLEHGYYPFYLEGLQDFSQKINNVIDKVLYEDITVNFSLKPGTVTVLKKVLWLVATSNGLSPVMDKISKNIGVSRELIYHAFELLEYAGLIKNIYPHAKGMKLVRKPGKVYMDNTNLLYGVHAVLKKDAEVGDIRETFFINQLKFQHAVELSDQGDFLIDEQIIAEVGGPSKTFRQIKGQEDAYLCVDGIKIGFGRKIPLYLFGLLY